MKKHNYWNEDRTRQREWEIVLAKKDEGNEYFKEGIYEEAINCYEEAKIMCPTENKKMLSNRLLGASAAIIDENLKTEQMIVEECIVALDQEDKMKALERVSRIRKHNRQMAKALEDVTWLCLLEGFSNDQPLLNSKRITKKIKHSMTTLDIVVRFLKELKHNAEETNQKNEEMVLIEYIAALELNRKGDFDFNALEQLSPVKEPFRQKSKALEDVTKPRVLQKFSEDQIFVNADTFMMKCRKSQGTSEAADRIPKESGKNRGLPEVTDTGICSAEKCSFL